MSGDPDLETDGYARETIVAEDGPVAATVTIETAAPDVESAGVLCDALAAANRSVVEAVFSDGMEAPRAAPAGGDGDADGGGDDGDGAGERIMDWEGHDDA